MRRGGLILLLLCLLLLGAAVGWLALGRTGQAPTANQFAKVNDQPEPGRSQTAQPRPDRPRGQGDGPRRPDAAGDNRQPTTTPEPVTPLPENAWLVKGRVASIMLDGVNLMGVMRPDDLPLGVCCCNFKAEDKSVYWPDVSFGPNYSLQGQIDFDRMPKDSVGGVWFQVSLDFGQETPLEQLAYGEDPLPDPATIKGLIKPRISGGVIDLGAVNIEIGDLPAGEFIAVGRLLGPGDLPLVSFDSVALMGAVNEDEVIESYLYANQQGRFAAMIEYDFDEEGASSLDVMEWSCIPDSDEEYEFHMRHIDPFDSKLGRTKLPRPARKGRVLDFGDIRLAGALVEIEAEILGIPTAPPPGDPFLGDPEIAVVVYLRTSQSSSDVDLLLGVPVRVLMPEGRYSWSAYLERPDCVCQTLAGSVAARAGEVARIKLLFKPEPLIPVTVLDPEGNVIADASIEWEVETQEDDWISGSAINGKLIPAIPGKTTLVSASHTRYESASADALAGATSVTIQFGSEVASTANLELVLPKLPAEFGIPKLEVRLSVRYGRKTSHDAVHLHTDKQDLSTVNGLPAGTCVARLAVGGFFGYPGGLLAELPDIELKGGETMRVEFPAILPPPWSVPIGKCIARISVGGSPAELNGEWVYETGTNDTTIEDGDTLVDAHSVKDGNSAGRGAIPSAFQAGPHRFATTVTMPARAWDEATMVLDMPTRLNVRVLRRGQPVSDFHAELRDDALDTHCQANSINGVARLWCGSEKAILTVQFGDNASRSIEVKLPPGESDHTFELNLVRVRFTQDEEDEVNWEWYPASRPGDTNSASTHQETLLPPGLYRLRPEREHDQSAAFDLDLSDGSDREVALPRITPTQRVDISLAMSEADWQGYQGAQFWYWSPVDGRDQPETEDFTYEQVELADRGFPDSLMLRSVPLGRTILLAGFINRRNDQGGRDIWFLQPISFKAEIENKFTPQWRKGARLHDEWSELNFREASSFPGHWIDPSYDMQMPPGRHEFVFPVGDGEWIRAWVDIPAGAVEFRIPPDLRRRLEAAEMLEPEEPPEPDED